ncbi:hypothetical protein VF14_34015 [Nostoc linckia z18]|uniref:Uncharacterized protein n=2 Tax=Nostoc linckia TaxID=92942 RepID=A0A9Q5ZDM6_NOSLI|nr:hypothetical protein VF02_09615 [Nostoc linckia z1]PHJ68985.1 hypothetical protein VF05_15250 [Nostoc linckia z3]PHJ74636.1 hypothetical protein VF03_14075 [Nostoc linckia z2]PHJ85479.1 hypothetical protein VF07_23075 [Nostoc linckia z6]PHJ87138.1 hypothetical protein VF06_02240 [Nostoc linckia z4]PHJ97460.1 hypothetical protein VF04_12115 [Nostoc linckia z7]PHK04626.1 hypothetical protein VF08_10355 [Nostoc linckia z8]PHK08728.1 hypothetical protein VF09_18510 [Nostoc linckia z9]PHK1349
MENGAWGTCTERSQSMGHGERERGKGERGNIKFIPFPFSLFPLTFSPPQLFSHLPIPIPQSPIPDLLQNGDDDNVLNSISHLPSNLATFYAM